MEIDPVVVLADELRTTEGALRAAVKRYEEDYHPESGETVNDLLNRIKTLYGDLYRTLPTSALGAGEMVRVVAQRLPFAHATYASHFHEVADRLGAGQRLHADLVWLRAMRSALADGICGEAGVKMSSLVELALAGAARPVLVWRAVEPAKDSPRDSSFWVRRLR